MFQKVTPPHFEQPLVTGDKSTGTQFLLPAPGLPTVPLKLAQRIWSLEFIEMEEFPPAT